MVRMAMRADDAGEVCERAVIQVDRGLDPRERTGVSAVDERQLVLDDEVSRDALQLNRLDVAKCRGHVPPGRAGRCVPTDRILRQRNVTRVAPADRVYTRA